MTTGKTRHVEGHLLETFGQHIRKVLGRYINSIVIVLDSIRDDSIDIRDKVAKDRRTNVKDWIEIFKQPWKSSRRLLADQM